MKAVIDSTGRLLIPQTLREECGLLPGTTVDISPYGSGIHVTPGGRAATPVHQGERLVITGETVLTDEILYSLIDEGRR
jgi:hypothetical protein